MTKLPRIVSSSRHEESKPPKEQGPSNACNSMQLANQRTEAAEQLAQTPTVTPECGQNVELSDAELAELNDQSKQTRYREQFQIQMKRRSCPGCGDG